MNMKGNSLIWFILAYVGLLGGVFAGALVSSYNPELGNAIRIIAIIIPILFMGAGYAMRYFKYIQMDVWSLTRRYIKHTIHTVLLVHSVTTRKLMNAHEGQLATSEPVYATVLGVEKVHWDDEVGDTDAVILIHTRPITERVFLERREVDIEGEAFGNMNTDDLTVWEYERQYEYFGHIYPICFIKEAGGDRIHDWSGPARFSDPGEHILPESLEKAKEPIPQQFINLMEGFVLQHVMDLHTISEIRETLARVLSKLEGLRPEIQGIMDDKRDSYDEGIRVLRTLANASATILDASKRLQKPNRLPYVIIAAIVAVAVFAGVLAYNPKLVEVLTAYAAVRNNQIFVVSIAAIAAVIAYILFRRRRNKRP
ncbi:MAG: hypothetical protein M1388_01115 [Thaumarchaeota archaeon]|nr:hypothetical protein [Nitrososphaerota archaeon]